MRFEDTPNVPDHFYRNNLPHFDPRDAPYSATYRLHGSISKEETARLFAFRRQNVQPWSGAVLAAQGEAKRNPGFKGAS
jgi:hypothetical protein